MKKVTKDWLVSFCVIAILIIMFLPVVSCTPRSVVVKATEVTEFDFSTVVMGDGVAYIPMNIDRTDGRLIVDVLDKFQSEKNVRVTSYSLDIKSDHGYSIYGICVTYVEK